MTSVAEEDLSNLTKWFRMFLVITTILSIFIHTMIYWHRGKHMRTLAGKIPGPPTLPFIGNANLMVVGNLSHMFKALCYLSFYGTIVRFWVGNLLFIHVSDPVAAERIMGNKKFLSRTHYATTVMKPYLKNGILISEGETWKLHRRMLAPHFGENVVRKYLSIFYKHATILGDRFQRFADGSSLFKIHELAFFCTMNTAWETTTGTILSPDLSENVDIPRNILRVVDITAERFRRPWLIFDWIFNFTSMKKENDTIVHYFQKLVRDVLEKRAKQFSESEIRTNMENLTPLVDRLLMDDQMSKEEMHEEMLNILAAASETTATLYCYTMCMLGVYQDVQDRLFQEQERIFQDDPHREITWEDLQKMTYTEQVVQEVLRLYPPISSIFRTIEEDTDVGRGYVLPEGSNALVFTFMLHRDPRYFPNPGKFDPERFSAGKLEGLHPYCYLPFGAGRRNCMGYKYGMILVKMMLSITLRRYRVVCTIGGREAIDTSLEAGLIMKPASGFNVQIAQRDTT